MRHAPLAALAPGGIRSDPIEVEIGDYPDWQAVIDGFDYALGTEISRVEIASVEGRLLNGSGFLEIHEAPAVYAVHKAPDEINDPAELAEMLKHSVRDIAADLLAEEGIGSHELGYLYGVLMSHVSKQIINSMAGLESELEAGRAQFEQAMALYQAVGDPYSIAYGLYYYARYLLEHGQKTEAIPLLERSATTFEERGRPQLAATVRAAIPS